jgi:hypothetical protein
MVGGAGVPCSCTRARSRWLGRARPLSSSNPKTGTYLDSLEFTLVPLLDVFAFIAMRPLAWASVITVLVVAAAGNRAINSKRRLPAALCNACASGLTN